jgi:hypothetical protein
MQHYSKLLGFLRNKKVTAEIVSLDPVKDHCRIVHLMTGYEFPWDIIRALEVALMKTFCSPKVSGLLHRTGEFRRHGQKRYDDTALLVAEFMQNGYDGERGQQAIAHINAIHGFYHIENDEFLFVLSTFVFMPIRWVDAYGWRKTTENERQALFYFFKAVGERMNIKNIPGSLNDLEKFIEEYEKNNVVLVETNHAVGNATVNIVKGWMPFFARPFVLPVMKCLLDKNMLKALGYPAPASLLEVLVNGAIEQEHSFFKKSLLKSIPPL